MSIMIFLTCPSCDAKIKMKWVNEGDQIVCFKCKTTSTISRDRNNRFFLEEEFFDDLRDIVEDIDFEFDEEFVEEEDLEKFLEDEFDMFPDEGVEFIHTDEDLDSYGVEIAVDQLDEDFYGEEYLEDEFGSTFEEYEEDPFDEFEDLDPPEEIEFAFEEGEYKAEIELEAPIEGYNVKVEYEDGDEFEEDDEFEDEEDNF